MTESIKISKKLSRQSFQSQVEKIAKIDGSYIDAVFTICERNDIEIEAVSFYITGALKERLTLEAKQKFLLRQELCKDQAVELPI